MAARRCAECGADPGPTGVQTVVLRLVTGSLLATHLKYCREHVPNDQERLRQHATAAETGVPPTPVPVPAPADTPPASSLAMAAVTRDVQYELIYGQAPKPARGLATELHRALVGTGRPMTAEGLTGVLMLDRSYQRVAPKAAAAKDPVKPVRTLLEGWAAAGHVKKL